MRTAGAGAVADALVEWVKREEGFRPTPYRCPAGYLTIGHGFNLEAGMTTEEAELLLRHRLDRLQDLLAIGVPAWSRMDPVRRGVLTAMAYQLGLAGVLRFKRMLQALEAGQYEEAAAHMLRSKWAQQTPTRARRTAEAMRSGRWPD